MPAGYWAPHSRAALLRRTSVFAGSEKLRGNSFAPSILISHGIHKNNHTEGCGYFGNGGGGSRTPVRKRFNKNFSGRRRLFTFPHPGVSRHTQRLGSFMIHGTRKALRTHVHHSTTPHPGPWSFRAGRPLIKQRRERRYRCSFIYKVPILRMLGASAR